MKNAVTFEKQNTTYKNTMDRWCIIFGWTMIRVFWAKNSSTLIVCAHCIDSRLRFWSLCLQAKKNSQMSIMKSFFLLTNDNADLL